MAEKEQIDRLRESLRLLVRRLGILERGEADCCGVTLAQCHVLVELGRAEMLSLNDLADLLRLDKSTVSRTVDNLVGSGLVLRDSDPADRRFVLLRLSADGAGVFAGLEERVDAYFGEIVDLLPTGKRDQVLDSLALLTAAVKGPKCCEAGPDGERGGR